ncbi:RNA/RNP complex-1-interacting phosphatase [Manis javanica]|nr:RNA/RNP complex-1-interacting phosphatase [Manis javanica]
MASCPLPLGPERRLFRTALRGEEGWKPRPQKSFEENLAPEECFSPLDLFNKVQEQNEELGLIIDLTYTHRYYKPEAWLPHLQLEEVPRDYQNSALKRSLKCPQPQVVGYSQMSGCVDVVADKMSGLVAENPRKSASLQRNKEEVSLCTNMMRKISLKKKLKRGAKVNTTSQDPPKIIL